MIVPVQDELRAMARERKVHAIGPDAPFVLAVDERGRLRLVDPSVGTVIDVRAYGADNAASFAALMPPAEPAQTASAAAVVKGE